MVERHARADRLERDAVGPAPIVVVGLVEPVAEQSPGAVEQRAAIQTSAGPQPLAAEGAVEGGQVPGAEAPAAARRPPRGQDAPREPQVVDVALARVARVVGRVAEVRDPRHGAWRRDR